MTRRMRQALPLIYRAIFFAGILALGLLGVLVLIVSAGWVMEGFSGAGLIGSVAGVWIDAVFVLVAFWMGPKLFASWDQERKFDDARRCVRCDRGTRPLFVVQGIKGVACKACLPMVQKRADGAEESHSSESLAREAGL